VSASADPWAQTRTDASPLPFHCPITVEPVTPNKSASSAMLWSPPSKRATKLRFLPVVQSRLLAPQPSFGLGDQHGLPGMQTNQVSHRGLGDHGQHVEQLPPNRVDGVANRPSQFPTNLARGELISNGSRIGQ
jgi:hypothetical protein